MKKGKTNRARIAALVLLAGCIGLLELGCAGTSQAQAKEEALARWQGVRAGMALQVAQQQFDDAQLDRARHILLEAIENHPDDPRLHLLMARVLFELQDLPAARAHLERAANLAPGLAEADYLQGVLLQSSGQWPQAHQAYLAGYHKAPNHLPYLTALAEAKLALGQAQQAAHLLSSRFGDFPSSAHLRIAAANSFLVMEDFDQAQRLYQQAIDIDPSNIEAQEGLANTLCLAGKYSQASRLLARLMKKYPHEDPGLGPRLADCYLAAGKHSLAIRTYRASLDENPHQPGLRLRLAQAWLLNGKAEKARQELQRLLQEQSDNPKVWVLLGHSYLQNEQFDLAAQAYRSAIDNGADPAQLQSLLDFCTQQEQVHTPAKLEPAPYSSANSEPITAVQE